jgi:hypothetical protein
MLKMTRKFCLVGMLALFIAMLLAIAPPPSATSYASPNRPSATETGATTDWANVRTGSTTSAQLVHTDAPGTTVVIYATVSGQAVWDNNSTWYRISSLDSSPSYIYGGLVTVSGSDINSVNSSASSGQGKIIVVSISQEELYAYNNGQLFITTPVTTGQVQLPTPTGTYHIFAKYSPYTFISPWPVGSPFYYSTVTANYAMEWRADGYFLHDAPWRTVFGKGTNYLHWDPQMGEDPGSHGCINVPTPAMAQIYNWATIGTTIQINP